MIIFYKLYGVILLLSLFLGGCGQEIPADSAPDPKSKSKPAGESHTPPPTEPDTSSDEAYAPLKWSDLEVVYFSDINDAWRFSFSKSKKADAYKGNLIAQGGEAAVFSGTMGGKPVAMKFFLSESKDGFLHEVNMLRKMAKIPGTMRVHHVFIGRDAKGIEYPVSVLDKLDVGSMDSWQHDPSKIPTFVKQGLEQIEAYHKAGVYFHDIKPGNMGLLNDRLYLYDVSPKEYYTLGYNHYPFGNSTARDLRAFAISMIELKFKPIFTDLVNESFRKNLRGQWNIYNDEIIEFGKKNKFPIRLRNWNRFANFLPVKDGQSYNVASIYDLQFWVLLSDFFAYAQSEMTGLRSTFTVEFFRLKNDQKSSGKQYARLKDDSWIRGLMNHAGENISGLNLFLYNLANGKFDSAESAIKELKLME